MPTKPLLSLIPLALLLLPLSGTAQDLLTLEQAITIGLANNYGLAFAKNEAEIAGNNATLGNAGFLPQISATGGLTRSRTDTRQELSNGTLIDRSAAHAEGMNGGVNLNWTLFDGFRMFVTRNKLQQLRTLGETSARLALEETLAAIIIAYFDIVRQQQTHRALADEIAISEGRLRTAQAKYQVGSGSRLELLRAQVDLNTDRSALFRQEVVLATARITLNQLLARPAETGFAVVDGIPLLPPLRLEELQRSARTQNLLLQQAQRHQDIARLELREIRSEWLPRLGLNLGYSYTRSETNAGFFRSNENLGLNASLSASLNLFDGFNTRRRMENARLELRNRAIAFAEVSNEVAAQLARAFHSYQSSLALIELERENLEVARENVTVALERFNVGTITSLELREAQKNLMDTETRLISSRFEAKRAETDLLRWSGRLVQEQ